MGLFNLFSKRQRRARGEMPDVYTYDTLPVPLRVQIVHILNDVLGDPVGYSSAQTYKTIHDILARELGVFTLAPKGRPTDPASDFFDFFLQCKNTEQAIDCVEVAFKLALIVHDDNHQRHMHQPHVSAESAIVELNARLREHSVGYQFESGEMVRIDSQLLHEDAVKPALMVLRDKRFAAAEQEFLRAHEHYRHGRHEEALADALKSLESTLKVICTKRGWTYNQTDAAKALLNVAFTNGLVPTYLQTEFSALRATIESGVPTVRNKQSGHGAGLQPRELPEHLVSYVLHLTASTLLFLVNSEAALP